MMHGWIILLLIALVKLKLLYAVELTFELYDNAKDCFYEVIEKNVSTTLEYQVRNSVLIILLNRIYISLYCLFVGYHRRTI